MKDIKRRSPPAASLQERQFKQQIVPAKRGKGSYNRKEVKQVELHIHL